MKIAMLSPIAWRTPPRHYGPWENIVSLLTEALVERGVDVTLYATGDSKTRAKLKSVVQQGYEENPDLNVKVWESLHIASLFDEAEQYDLIHNHFDFLPLSYAGLTQTPMLTTIHGFSSPKILPVYQKYNAQQYYVSISNADRAKELNYHDTIYHGIDLSQFTFKDKPEDYLLFFGRFHQDKGAKEAIEIAKQADKPLIMAGIIQDQDYFDQHVAPHIDDQRIRYIGSVGPEKRNELLGGAQALLHPINFAEPFGLSVIEAMACGTPVIAFNKGSMPEIILDGETGYLCENTDQAIAQISALKYIDRGRCRQHIEENFTAAKMADNYLRVYQQIIDATAKQSHRPWGHYQVLADANDYKTKEIHVLPGKRLSLQSHRQRDEHWFMLEGEALVTLDDKVHKLQAGQAIDIPRGTKHRISNPSFTHPLRFIEVQTGDYFGEDDIVRYEDDFGRTG